MISVQNNKKSTFRRHLNIKRELFRTYGFPIYIKFNVCLHVRLQTFFQSMCSLGIDLSMTSPGLVVQDPSNKQIIAYFYPTRKKEISSVNAIDFIRNEEQWLFVVSALKVCKSTVLMERYDTIRKDVIHIIQTHDITSVGIEGYAFNAQSSSASKLFELGGLIRHAIWQQDIDYQDIAPTSVKKQFTGSGKATKEDMWLAYLKKGYPDLIALLRLNSVTTIPHPVQDIVDAIALVEIIAPDT